MRGRNERHFIKGKLKGENALLALKKRNKGTITSFLEREKEKHKCVRTN